MVFASGALISTCSEVSPGRLWGFLRKGLYLLGSWSWIGTEGGLIIMAVLSLGELSCLGTLDWTGFGVESRILGKLIGYGCFFFLGFFLYVLLHLAVVWDQFFSQPPDHDFLKWTGKKIAVMLAVIAVIQIPLELIIAS